MRKFKIYECGKMAGLKLAEMNEWRLTASQLLYETGYPITIVNPVNFYNFTLDPTTYTEREVMDFDLYQVRDSDLILVNLDFPNSIGTAIEMFYAHDILKIPVVSFGTMQNHPWIQCCVNKHCETLEEAVEYIKDFYLAIHR